MSLWRCYEIKGLVRRASDPKVVGSTLFRVISPSQSTDIDGYACALIKHAAHWHLAAVASGNWKHCYKLFLLPNATEIGPISPGPVGWSVLGRWLNPTPFYLRIPLPNDPKRRFTWCWFLFALQLTNYLNYLLSFQCYVLFDQIRFNFALGNEICNYFNISYFRITPRPPVKPIEKDH